MCWFGDDMTTPIAEGRTTSPYGGDVPISILKGAYTVDFSATVRVTSVEDTRTIHGEITSFTNIIGQNPEHNVVILYLCQPISDKAKKLSDGMTWGQVSTFHRKRNRPGV